MGSNKHTPNEIHIQGDVAFVVLTNRARLPIAVTMIDATDVEIVQGCGFRWCAYWTPKIQNYYVKGRTSGVGQVSRTVALHKFLLQTPDGLHTDHINNNSLDNRRKNLRPATPRQNALNHRPGAYLKDRSPIQPKWATVWTGNRWQVRITFLGKRMSWGSFATRDEADTAAEEAMAQYMFFAA